MLRKFIRAVAPLSCCALIAACSHGTDGPANGEPPMPADTLKPTIIAAIPHDSLAFTQGLIYHEGFLYESTGLYGHSGLRKVDAQTGEVLQSIPLGGQYFGEGLALKGGRLVQLTWLEGRAFVYSFPGLAPADTFYYDGQGWGLAADSGRFIMSDGSENLYFRDDDFRLAGTVKVTRDGQPISSLNELEYANGYIYANIWYSNSILEINPQSGQVSRVIDCSELAAIESPADPRAVLNGIAYRPDRKTFYCTGKLWRNLFEIRLD